MAQPHSRYRHDLVRSLADEEAFRPEAPARWLTPDPAGLAAVDLTNPQSLNRYAYVLNNPTTLIDPSGLDPCDQPGENPDAQCVNVYGNPTSSSYS
ncbi:MAG TPA: RHS repeat-associated core domain-containing protein [Terriglobia bacterium]|nr:RHS repeat-associated core domain-containing protein [Terriglobia bacterium]